MFDGCCSDAWCSRIVLRGRRFPQLHHFLKRLRTRDSTVYILYMYIFNIYIYTPTIYHVSNILASFHSSRDEYSGVNAALWLIRSCLIDCTVQSMASSHSAYGYTRINLKSEKNGLLEVGRGKALQNFNRESYPERHQAGTCYHLPCTTISRIFYSLDYIGIDTTPYDTNTQPVYVRGFFWVMQPLL